MLESGAGAGDSATVSRRSRKRICSDVSGGEGEGLGAGGAGRSAVQTDACVCGQVHADSVCVCGEARGRGRGGDDGHEAAQLGDALVAGLSRAGSRAGLRADSGLAAAGRGRDAHADSRLWRSATARARSRAIRFGMWARAPRGEGGRNTTACRPGSTTRSGAARGARGSAARRICATSANRRAGGRGPSVFATYPAPASRCRSRA